jgi:hypothetical protein
METDMTTTEQEKIDGLVTRMTYDYYTLTVQVREDKLPAVIKEIVAAKDVMLVKAEFEDVFLESPNLG